MATVDEMYAAVEFARNNLEKIAREIISASDKSLVELLQIQLQSGQTGDGEYISPEYASYDYAVHKQNMGSRSPFGVPDLKYTGEFYRKMVLTWTSDNSFSIISNDVKWRKLISRYGLNVMKLSEFSIQWFIVNGFSDDMIRKLSEITGIKFS